jgi:prephenate dehydratase
LKTSRIAYQGERGAFSEQACRRFLPDWVPLPKPSFAAALEAVRGGEARGAMLPLENGIAGIVPDVSGLIDANHLFVLARYSMPVRLHLLALPGTCLIDVLTVASHPMALAQCRDWLAGSGLKTHSEENTAVAARRLASSGNRSLAVIASEEAARCYNLRILVRDLQDVADNATIFGLVARAGEKLQ